MRSGRSWRNISRCSTRTKRFLTTALSFHQRRSRGLLAFGQCSRPVVYLGAWMERQNGRVRFGIWWQARRRIHHGPRSRARTASQIGLAGVESSRRRLGTESARGVPLRASVSVQQITHITVRLIRFATPCFNRLQVTFRSVFLITFHWPSATIEFVERECVRSCAVLLVERVPT